MRKHGVDRLRINIPEVRTSLIIQLVLQFLSGLIIEFLKDDDTFVSCKSAYNIVFVALIERLAVR
jgi:hypothetical protein